MNINGGFLLIVSRQQLRQRNDSNTSFQLRFSDDLFCEPTNADQILIGLPQERQNPVTVKVNCSIFLIYVEFEFILLYNFGN